MNEEAYRRAEQALLADAGLAVDEVLLPLARLRGTARALVAGPADAEPVLFLSGGPDAGATWAYAAARLPGLRAILLDRPGTGLSPRAERRLDIGSLSSYVADLTADVLDGLGIERAMLVGCSFGGFSALCSAAAYPDRVTGVYLAGSPAFVPGWAAPRFFTLLRTPVLGRLFLRLPASKAGAEMSLRLLGHRRSLAAGRIPKALLDWVLAWQGHTDTMRNDAEMICALGTWLGGFDRSLDLDATQLAAVGVPAHVLVGTDDPVGSAEVGSRLALLLPEATLEVWEGAGHLPWYDDPARFAESVTSFRRSAARS